jgi:hypothetical protein
MFYSFRLKWANAHNSKINYGGHAQRKGAKKNRKPQRPAPTPRRSFL